tara:strand:- start:388 stop:792 length:405 start_codon:yes stop_codon:yes gene_type:complete
MTRGLNNIHFNFPSLMNDGRTVSNYESSVSLDNKLKQTANINSNTDYRKYLQTNADSIIKNNQLTACSECTVSPYYLKTTQNNNFTKPYIFDSILSNDQPYGYETSDLKNLYLSKESLHAQLHAPRFKIPNTPK